MPARERSSTGVEADFDLRKLLDRPGSYAAIAASAAYGRRSHFPVTLFDHIGDVYRRVETAAGAELPDVIARLRLTALVHEEPPRSLPALLASTGLSGFTPIVVAVTGAFGRV